MKSRFWCQMAAIAVFMTNGQCSEHLRPEENSETIQKSDSTELDITDEDLDSLRRAESGDQTISESGNYDFIANEQDSGQRAGSGEAVDSMGYRGFGAYDEYQKSIETALTNDDFCYKRECVVSRLIHDDTTALWFHDPDTWMMRYGNEVYGGEKPAFVKGGIPAEVLVVSLRSYSSERVSRSELAAAGSSYDFDSVVVANCPAGSFDLYTVLYYVKGRIEKDGLVSGGGETARYAAMYEGNCGHGKCTLMILSGPLSMVGESGAHAIIDGL